MSETINKKPKSLFYSNFKMGTIETPHTQHSTRGKPYQNKYYFCTISQRTTRMLKEVTIYHLLPRTMVCKYMYCLRGFVYVLCHFLSQDSNIDMYQVWAVYIQQNIFYKSTTFCFVYMK